MARYLMRISCSSLEGSSALARPRLQLHGAGATADHNSGRGGDFPVAIRKGRKVSSRSPSSPIVRGTTATSRARFPKANSTARVAPLRLKVDLRWPRRGLVRDGHDLYILRHVSVLSSLGISSRVRQTRQGSANTFETDPLV